MSKRLRLGLLFGGRSVEHEVSVVSARGVLAAVNESDLDGVPLAVTGSGEWLSPEVSLEILEGGSDRAEPPAGREDRTRLVLDPGGGGLLRAVPGRALQPVPLDVVFPLIHGWGGEDGRVQGLLELASIPYVGAGVLGSAVGMDKSVAKQLFRAHGLAVVPGRVVDRRSFELDRARVEGLVADELGFPVFVKPVNGGSSIGITRVASAAGLADALVEAFRHDRRALVERGLDAREIECAVLGNEEPRASGLGEILPSREFYDYDAKYVDGTSGLEIPADLPPEVTATIRERALTAYRALDLCGFARVDFLLERKSGQAYVNEVNTLPGFTPISMFPKLWEASGLAYPKLIERLVELALDRSREVERLATRRGRA